MGKRIKKPRDESSEPETTGTHREVNEENKIWHYIRAIKTDFALQILVALVIIGFFLRFYHLGFNSLWLDEAFTYYSSNESILQIWETTKTGDFHPPLFHWIEHFMLYLGNNEFILRFIPAVVGTLTIPLFYIFGKEVMNKNVGVISAALLTFSPFHIYYSQEAYSYSLVVFVFSLILIFNMRAICDNKRKDWIIVGLLSAVGFWIHYYVAIPIAVLFLHAILTKIPEFQKDKRSWKNPLLSLILFLVCIAPLILVVIERYFTLTSKPPTYGVFGLALITETFIRFSALTPLVAVVFVLLFVIGLFSLYKIRKSYCLLFILLITIPLGLSVAISSIMTMNPRYLLYLLAIFYTGIASSYCMLPRFPLKKWVVLLIVIGIAAINAPILPGYYQTPIKDDWRSYSSIIAENTREGDFIILIPEYNKMPFGYYYDNVTDHTSVFGATTPDQIEQIVAQQGNNTIIYVLTNDITAANPEGDTVNWLNENTEVVGQYTNIYTFIS